MSSMMTEPVGPSRMLVFGWFLTKAPLTAPSSSTAVFSLGFGGSFHRFLIVRLAETAPPLTLASDGLIVQQRMMIHLHQHRHHR